VLSTIIFSVDIKRSTSVEGWLSPSGAWNEWDRKGDEKLDEKLIKDNLINFHNETSFSLWNPYKHVHANLYILYACHSFINL